MIRDGHLYPNDFLQKHDVISHRSGQCRGGDFIRAGQTVSGDSLFVKGFGLCQQVLHTAGPGIRPQKSHQRSNARFYAVGKAKLRHTAGKTALPAPACNMHMLVDQPGDYPATGSVQNPASLGQRFHLRLYGNNPVVADQNIPFAQVARTVNIRILHT